ncbi:Suf-domain-containing protein [Tothia fuscella]|uniref:mRNA 3'-end-processing protein RNA14 n=1 Tax=Tothia fuscella TaxID=1048955 RepID=A0A9P4NQ46_9PEZI|nr:Suf-domain-containing protein [Tothia fuscella]
MDGNEEDSPQRSENQTPINTLPLLPDTSIDKAAQDQGSSAVATDSLPNHAASLSSSSGVVVAVVTPTQVQAPAPTPSAAVPTSNGVPASAAVVQSLVPSANVPLAQARAPQDRIGVLEDRIVEDPRGDIDAWLSLISEYRQQNKLTEVREVYERFFKRFPTATEQWVSYANMELDNEEFGRAEQIFTKTLINSTGVDLWIVYLDYIRRRHNTQTDATGNNRRIVQQAFDLILNKVGIDKDSGSIWSDYITFVKSGPGTIGGTGWQDNQKMDALRAAYRRALAVPTNMLNSFWTEYQQFERTLNKQTGQKNLQEMSPAYVQAKNALNQILAITQRLNRTSLPRLPPAPGFDGFQDHEAQVQIWKSWIQWEKKDELVLREDDLPGFHQRVLYVYKQAVGSLRYEPQIWVEAADYCFANDMESEGNDFLKQGIEANPESCLLAFKQGDRVEQATVGESSDPEKRGNTVREPYDRLLEALYDLIKKVQARKEQDVKRVRESFALEAEEVQQQQQDNDDDDEDADDEDIRAKHAAEREEAQVKAVENSANAQIMTLRKTLTSAWIALLRAIRRVQGSGNRGKLDDPIPGSRGIMAQARKRGQLTSDLYVAQALIEHHCYRSPSAAKLFTAGMGLFPDDENLALEFVKHLIDINDITNARATFEKVVGKLTSKPETTARAKPLFLYMHDYESKYGDLAQISKLEQRMRDHFPEDPNLKLFEHRFAYTNALGQTFDPTLIRPIISPATQMRVGAMPIPTIEMSPAPSIEQSLPYPHHKTAGLADISPKRNFDAVDAESSQYGPRKMQRGESPLKGAAGRRLDAARRRGGDTPMHAATSSTGPSLPRDINFLLSVLPKKTLSQNMNPQIIPEAMVHLLRGVNLHAVDWARADLKAAGPGLLQANRLAQPPHPQIHPQLQPQPQVPHTPVQQQLPQQPPPMAYAPPMQGPPQGYSPVTQYPPQYPPVAHAHAPQYPPPSPYGQYAPPPTMNGYAAPPMPQVSGPPPGAWGGYDVHAQQQQGGYQYPPPHSQYG